jgi:4'-phosphopantetheinyl transferase
MDVGPVHHHDASHVATLPADRLAVLGVAWTLSRPAVVPLSALAPAGAWIVDLDDPRAPEGARLESGVRPDELERAARRGHANARRWLRSRVALRSVLGACLDRDPLSLELRSGPTGKLAIDGPTRLDFSVAHSFARAVIGVSLAGAVGVDVELVRPGLHEVAIARRVLGEDVSAVIEGAARESRTSSFFAAWVRHEAALKCRGRRLVDSFGADPAVGLALRPLDAGEGYAAAWAGTERLIADAVATVPFEWSP